MLMIVIQTRGRVRYDSAQGWLMSRTIGRQAFSVPSNCLLGEISVLRGSKVRGHIGGPP